MHQQLNKCQSIWEFVHVQVHVLFIRLTGLTTQFRTRYMTIHFIDSKTTSTDRADYFRIRWMHSYHRTITQ